MADQLIRQIIARIHAERSAEALTLFEEGYAASPESTALWCTHGRLPLELGDFPCVHVGLAQAARLNPADIEVLHQLGRSAYRQADDPVAISALETVLRREPRHLHARGNLALAHAAQAREWAEEGDFARATAAYAAALRWQDVNPDLLISVGINARHAAKSEHALALLRRAVTVAQRDDGAAHTASANTGPLPAVPGVASRQLACARYSLGTQLLRQGQCAEGWPLYESALTAHGLLVRCRLGLRRWRGEAVHGDGTLVVESERGLGDTSQFCRYAPDLLARIARVSLVVSTTLERLLRHSLPTSERVLEEVARLPAGRSAHHINLASLLALLGISAVVPALRNFSATHAVIDGWRERFLVAWCRA